MESKKSKFSKQISSENMPVAPQPKPKRKPMMKIKDHRNYRSFFGGSAVKDEEIKEVRQKQLLDEFLGKKEAKKILEK